VRKCYVKRRYFETVILCFNNIFWHEGEFMAELEVKAKPARYPLGTIKQARNTLARLTRDLLNKKIDKDIYRAACYGISVQCGLFKLEQPNKPDVLVIPPPPLWEQGTHEENEQRIDELMRKAFPDIDEYEQWKADKESNGQSALLVTEVEQTEPAPDTNTQNDTGATLGVPAKQPEPAEALAAIEDTGAAWKPCGIGARRGTL
jgi:hypothetical protein